MYAVGDVVKITTEQFLSSQRILQVWFGVCLDEIPDGEIDNFMNDWADDYANILAPLVTESLVFGKTRIDNLTDGLSFFVSTFAEGRLGTLQGDYHAPFVAVGYTLLVPTKITRPGSKRFAGVIEGQTVNGQLDTQPQADWDAAGASFVAPTGIWRQDVAPGESRQISPAIIGRTNVGTSEEPDYIVDITKINFLSGISSARITHQTSRAVGRGE